MTITPIRRWRRAHGANHGHTRRWAAVLLCLWAWAAVAGAAWFEDATVAAGVDALSNSFGVSWGDQNGDGYPDLYLSNHWHDPSLYLNQGDGSFIDTAGQHEIHLGHRDAHGGTWGDWDNDGDQDLILAVGGFNADGSIPDTPYFENIDGTLLMGDPADTGLNYTYSARTPVWLDENSDGLLDMLMVSRPQVSGFYTALLRQVSPGQFQDVTPASGLDGNLAAAGFLLAGPNSPRRPEIMLNRGAYFRWNGSQWQNVTGSVFPELGSMVDAAHGDVNGDGLLDLYVAREGTRSEVVVDDAAISLAYKTTPDVTGTIDFQGGGVLHLIRSLNLSRNSIRLGAAGTRPVLVNDDDPVVLDPADPDVLGEPSAALETALRVFVWYTPEDGYWHFRLGKLGSGKLVEMEIHGQSSLADVQITGIDAVENPPANKLFINNGAGGYTLDGATNLKLGPTRSTVLADLDNDMDLDLYVVNRNAVTNLPNQLFENQGDGSFVEVADAGGAAGPATGNGDSVSFADYDLDGFLDLFVASGRSDLIMAPYPGPNNLFRNLGNGNRWLQIDLEGTNSARDAIGALVELEAGGVTQARLQDGGIHAFSQNYRRLHFGLAGNDIVDSLTIRWPSGTEQVLQRVPVNQVLQIVEPEKPLSPGVPAALPGGADGVYLWKDSFNGPYHLRTVHTDPASSLSVSVLSDRPLAGAATLLAPAGLQDWQPHHYGFDLATNQADAASGVDFQLHSAARAVFSVQIGGTVNPRTVHLGPDGDRPSLAGWLLNTADLPDRPDFQRGVDRGLFMGRNVAGDGLEFRWNGDGRRHTMTLDLFAREPSLIDVEADDLEGRDTFSAGAVRSSAYGAVKNSWDGLRADLRGDTDLAILYTQDGLFQPDAVNHRDVAGALGEPNAYHLPAPSSYGEPDYDTATESNVFVWQDHLGRWRLRASAGPDLSRFAGRVIADQAPIAILPRNLEGNDSLDTSDPKAIRFNLATGFGFWDGLDLRYPPGTTVRLYIDEASKDVLDVLRIGQQRWPVHHLPVVFHPAEGAKPPPAPEQVTGQTVSFAPGDDGDLQAGEPFPAPRFADNGDGTVHDLLTGLTWLGDADCFGQQTWAGSLAAAAGLQDGQCGLSDGSLPGAWRLANIRELVSLLDFGVLNPALPAGHPFSQVQNAFYWSSTTTDGNAGRAWGAQFAGGNLERRNKSYSQHPVTSNPHYVWPVKGP